MDGLRSFSLTDCDLVPAVLYIFLPLLQYLIKRMNTKDRILKKIVKNYAYINNISKKIA